jgi:hypothetical protein
MTDVAWEMAHTVEVGASADFAWSYWTDVRNWDDPPASFELEGAFREGAHGVTHTPGQPPISWFIREVTSGESATIEIPADGAAMVFEWRFVAAGAGRTRISQRAVLLGEKAEMYLGYAKAFETNLPGGMKKLASAIADAAASRGEKR